MNHHKAVLEKLIDVAETLPEDQAVAALLVSACSLALVPQSKHSGPLMRIDSLLYMVASAVSAVTQSVEEGKR